MTNVRAIKDRATRKPSGKPPWPILLVAGAEKAGKTYESALASASDLIGRTLWIGVGEDDPDEYGAIPGARFEIVEHDGTYRDVQSALTWAAQLPTKDGKPNLVVLDSGTRLWDLLCDEAQYAANKRAEAKARRANRPASDEDVQITMDLWNVAKQRWAHCIDALRDHQGPSIITARLEHTVIVENGEPTKEKTWKVKAEKSLPFDVGATVELPTRGEAFLTGVRSLRFKPAQTGRTAYVGFSVDKLWRDLGLDGKDAAGVRAHTPNDPTDKPLAEADAARVALRALCDEHGWVPAEVAAKFVDQNGGLTLSDATADEITAHAKWCGENFKAVQAS